MSTHIRKVKVRGQKSPAKIARVKFLVLGSVLIAIGIVLPVDSPNPIRVNVDSAVFSQTVNAYNPVKIDPGFIQPQSLPKLNREIPTQIIIPSVAIDIPVKESKIVNGYWEVFENSAGWGEGSAAPDEIGNQVIFAHARQGLFLPLQNVKSGQKVYILTDNKFYTYEVESIHEVNPSETEVIKPTPDSVLTLYTCSGLADSKRLIVKAKKILI